jgi:hypothetical protein
VGFRKTTNVSMRISKLCYLRSGIMGIKLARKKITNLLPTGVKKRGELVE